MNESRVKRPKDQWGGRPARALGLNLPTALLVASLAAFGREPRLVTQYYLVNAPSSVQSFEANYARISVLSPQWFSVDEKGNVESSVDSGVRETAEGKGVPLMPLVVNEKFLPATAHAVLGDASLETQVIGRLVEIAVGQHFLGYQLDFENIPAEDRDRYSAFIHQAAREFRRSHLELSVAVPPPLTPPPAASALAPPASSGWIANNLSAAFDYHSIAKDVDFISLMAYDEYTSPGQPGPVAGRPWVEACIRQTLDAVPAKKLLLGLPLYYREWSGKSVNEGSIPGAHKLAEKWNARIVADPEQHEAFFTFSDGQQQHTVWLEDNESLREIVELADQMRLAGIAAWRLGFEDPSAWETAMRIKIVKVR